VLLRPLLILSVALALLGPVAPAGAHTELLQSSPGAFTEVGGTVDFIDLVFMEPVRNVDIEVVGPDGVAIDGEMEVPDGQIIRYRMSALEIVGDYTVSYTLISADLDDTAGRFVFSYVPTAGEPFRLGEVDLPSNTWRNIGLAASAVVGLGLIALILVMLARLERNRAALAAQRSKRP
jgi:methionine-rich copper-binding protein CopC